MARRGFTRARRTEDAFVVRWKVTMQIDQQHQRPVPQPSEVSAEASTGKLDFCRRIHRDGFALVLDVIDAEIIENLRSALEQLGHGAEVRRKGGAYGARHLLQIS